MKSRAPIMILMAMILSFSICIRHDDSLFDISTFETEENHGIFELAENNYSTTPVLPWREEYPINQTVSGPIYPTSMEFEVWGLNLRSGVSRVVCFMECTTNFTLTLYEDISFVATFPEAENLTLIHPKEGGYVVMVYWGDNVGTYNLTIYVYYGYSVSTTTVSNMTDTTTPPESSTSSTSTEKTLTSTSTGVDTTELLTGPTSSSRTDDGWFPQIWGVLGPSITIGSIAVIVVVLILIVRNRKLT